MTPLVEQLLEDLSRWNESPPVQRHRLLSAADDLHEASAAEVGQLLAGIRDEFDRREAAGHPMPDEAALRRLLAPLVRREPDEAETLSPADLQLAVELYGRLDPATDSRGALLGLLATQDNDVARREFVRLLCDDPPRSRAAVDLALVPLFRWPSYAVLQLFPDIFGALAHPALAAAVLDLANYLYRQGVAARHPAADRREELTALLGQTVEFLENIQEQPARHAQSAADLSDKVNQAIALLTALADALALMGEPAAIGKLQQALHVRHRRVVLEAAAALMRLGDPHGTDVLVQAAADPASRTRALQYLEEYGALERVPPELRSPEAQAEGEVVLYLSGRERFGLPPQRIELVDHTRQYWPGYSEPIDCFLFHYEYELAQFRFSGIAVAGPVVHTVLADLEDLPPADIYALFAGWHAEHPEIVEVSAGQLDPAQREVFQRQLSTSAGEQGFLDARLELAGGLLGDTLLVGTATRDGRPGIVVLEQGRGHWYPQRSETRPLSAENAYWLHKGRKLLQAFNRPEA